MTDNRAEFNEAMVEARANPRDLLDHPLPGLPTDPIELRAHMMWLEYAAFGKGRGPEFKEQARRSFEEWMSGDDGLGPWRD